MTQEQSHTPGPWVFERMESAVEFAALKGETLDEHEGYYRDNNGDWIVTYKDPDPEGYGGRIAGVSFKGTAKRGQAYGAPDPNGQANARLIAAAPDMLEALEALADAARSACDARQHPPLTEALFDATAAIAKAKGETR